MEKKYKIISDIIRTKHEYLKELNEIVGKTIAEEELISNNLAHPPEETLTKGQKLSDKVAEFGGSWYFITVFGVVMTVWMVANSFILRGGKAFDPYPYILLNLVLSCLAAMQAPIIMMSQNRKEERDRRRAENDYLVNLKAEIEIRNLHAKMDLLMEKQFANMLESQKVQLEILERIEKALAKSSKNDSKIL